MTRRAQSEGCALVVAIAGLVVMAGWIFDVEVLKRVHPDWVSMKFSTAFCFFLCGLMLVLLHSRNPMVRGFGLAVGLMAQGYMSAVAADQVFGGELRIAEAFVRDDKPLASVGPGIPSICTMVAFTCVVLASPALVFGWPRLARWLFAPVAIASLAALCGYLVGWPPLYCYFDGTSTAMAVHTSVLFGLLAVSGSRIQ